MPTSFATVDCARIVKDENKAIEIANEWIELFYKQVVENEYDRTKTDVIEKAEDCSAAFGWFPKMFIARLRYLNLILFN